MELIFTKISLSLPPSLSLSLSLPLSLSLSLTHTHAHTHTHKHSFKDGGKLVLIILSLIGFFTFDMVYVTAVMNYAAQSEMLVYLLRSVRGLVEQKGYEDIDGAIKVGEVVCMYIIERDYVGASSKNEMTPLSFL